MKQQPNCYFAYESLILLHDEDLDAKSTRLADIIISKMYLKLFHMFPDKGLGWTGLGIVISNQNSSKTQ